MAFLPTMVPCPGAITIASSAQKDTICSTSRPAAAAEAHIASILSSSARALSISRLSLIVHFPLQSQLQGTLISCVPENLDQVLRGDRGHLHNLFEGEDPKILVRQKVPSRNLDLGVR